MKHYHFIGIGGAGMGTLASLLLDKGEKVSGSDLKAGAMTQDLERRGAKIFIGHDAKNVDGADYVIYSSAVTPANPEIVEARKRGVLIQQRAQLLAQLMEHHVGITIAGAHGKTTTTSMISNLLLKAGLNPTTAVGGIVRGGSYNAHLGEGKYFVSEVDESDGSFLYFSPQYSVITNIDFEHVDYYHTWENILNAYAEFVDHTDIEGMLIVCGEDSRLKKLAVESGRKFMTYGFSPEFDVHAENLRFQGCTSKFECFHKNKKLGTIQLVVPGRHNVLNALAAICVGLNFQLSFEAIAESFLAFQGVNRRFQIKGRVNEIMLVDDYGHHPTEIMATLTTARSLQKKRVLTVFQPHRYTRTKFLMKEFGQALLLADHLVLTDIYAASEPAIEGVSAQALCDQLKAAGHPSVQYFKKEDIVAYLLRTVQPGDMVLTLGAGDITRLGDEFLAALTQKSGGPAVGADASEDNRNLGHIGVLMGGCSSEREISFKSGKAIVKALSEAGCDASAVEIDSCDEESVNALLRDAKIDVAFIALHGEFGEDGGVQTILENAGIPYTGSDVTTSRITINKVLTQQKLKENGLCVPAFQILNEGEKFSEEKILQTLGGLPVIVKPACEGSSIGITIVKEKEKFLDAVKLAFTYGSQVLIEQFIVGKEITAGILGGEALPLVEIRPKHVFFDYEAKYQKGMTDYIVPAEIPDSARDQIQQAAVKAYRILGCRDLSRIDFILNETGEAYLLEVNTIPGFTETSLLPKAAKQAGISFSDLCLKIVRMALNRKARQGSGTCCSNC